LDKGNFKNTILAAEVKCTIYALLVKVENRKAGKFRTRQEKNLLDLEDVGDERSHYFDSHVGEFHGAETECITECIRQFCNLLPPDFCLHL
jgi:hypothetical protein